MREMEIEKQLKFKQETTEHSMNDSYRRVTKMGKRFTDISVNEKFTEAKRKKMLKQMIAYFESCQEFEKCFVLMEILKEFNVLHFSTESYK